MKKAIVIGGGISGLCVSYFLKNKFELLLLEQNDYIGGHSHTHTISENNKVFNFDSGFIVFNNLNYQNYIKVLEENNVEYEKSNMSFSVSIQNTKIEYGGKNLNSIFANRSNIFNYNFIKMIKEIISFYKTAPDLLKNENNNQTLGNYLKQSKLSKYFVDYHLIPMVAAIWSMPFSKAKDIPLKLFLNFFINHGLFKLKNRPQWYTVTNRSRTYVKKALEKISGEVFKNYKVEKIKRNQDNVRITIGNEYLDYDQIILASHADQNLEMLQDPTIEEKRILGKFKYVSNSAYLHTDENLMPKKKIAWSSWNSISKNDKTCVTYWLNNLQNLNCENNYFLTLNPVDEIHKDKLIKKINFTHPYSNLDTFKFQKDLNAIQGKKRTWYCGSYFGYGFHEDGLNSSINLIKNFKY